MVFEVYDERKAPHPRPLCGANIGYADPLRGANIGYADVTLPAAGEGERCNRRGWRQPREEQCSGGLGRDEEQDSRMNRMDWIEREDGWESRQ
jgi:hypothetical protein